MIDEYIVPTVVEQLVIANAIPNISFKQGSLLSNIVESCTTVAVTEADETEVETALRWVDNFITNGIQDELIDKQFDAIANQLVAGIETTVGSIQDIHETVAGIVSKVDADVKRAVTLDPQLKSLVLDDEAEISYPSLDYSPLEVLSKTGQLLLTMREQVSATTATDKESYKAVCSNYLRATVKAVAVDVDLESIDKDVVVTELNDGSDEWDVDDVRDIIELLTKASRIRGMAKRVEGILKPKTNYTNDLVSSIQLVDQYATLLPLASKALIAAGITEDGLIDNIARVSALLDLCYYFATYHRVTTFGDTALFNNGLLNPDVSQRMVNEGITSEDIAQHIVVVWKGDVKVPTGVTLSSVISRKERVTEQYGKKHAADKFYMLRELANITERVSTRYLSEFFGSQGLKLDDQLKYKLTEMRRKDLSLEDVCFDMVLKHCHSNNKLVRITRDMLGEAYTTVLKENPEIETMVLDDYTMRAHLEVVTSVLVQSSATI